jgi:hypothetical protein
VDLNQLAAVNASALHLLEKAPPTTEVIGARFLLQQAAKLLDDARSPAAPVVEIAAVRRAKSRN